MVFVSLTPPWTRSASRPARGGRNKLAWERGPAASWCTYRSEDRSTYTNSDLFANCLTWPQAGRLKSPHDGAHNICGPNAGTHSETPSHHLHYRPREKA